MIERKEVMLSKKLPFEIVFNYRTTSSKYLNSAKKTDKTKIQPSPVR